MDPHGALFFYLCLLAAQVVLVETLSDLLVLMKRLEQPVGRGLSSRARHIHSLEQKLLNASFGGHNLTLQTNSIQSLVFKLSCDFPGLSLSSTTLTNVSQVRAPHAMQFPAELTKGACVTSRPAELRLICIYFFTAHLFQDDRNSSLLNNYVLGAQLDHRPVNNLQKPVNISFWHNRSLEGYTVSCVFWKEGASKSSWGAWSPEGCYTEQPSATQVLCHCNHLTYFAVLMQLSGDPVPAELQVPLEYISFVGCSISIVASLLTILLYAQSRKQSDSTTRIHMNLNGSVLLLNVTFLLSSQMTLPTMPRPVCKVLAAVLHYALLSSLTWMAIEGFNLYLFLGRVYNAYIRRYLLKLCMLGWGFPALLVLLLLMIKSSVYGPCVTSLSKSQENGTGFQNVSMCWIRSPMVHSILVMGYGGFTSLFNLVVLAWALWILCRLRAREKALSPWAYRDTAMVLGLTVLLGTTWTLAFFSFGVFLLPQLFLFTIFNSLYGFFLFLWFCSQKRYSDAEAKAEMEAVSSSQMTH
ncbi:adhesion G-protein coupled receptor G5 isoform X2 [Mus musculus]|uniref:Adhesion G-protein coupled receptor G5 n=2 Tax=Mus musculus TaxID=10090 RepID=AGRG5_MOUSE|nr:adhesion G-protein coupled receptor G5 isoform 1 precursor [Mus musculus]XP_017168373.1 adhesion G-protein coupled receptor G5 isoform X2 [Mus musculus]XP_017168374.1 adhesion G-protein coupled receptor G5 isoform X2 [Mus musculus]XP_017168375.1 adhesion G-protein coupled receptor G5 isoform X2 [Mus musculus]Q3V3Z3.3 RecName: Full=Adhesion G-protein coupled receptor G5; AltName: Full=G-protein coupled receptor 114; AltName: Full=G-protein coupled receptor PGR27; Flags: Precursor [Mus musculu|eukprot:NP_001139444.1 adhesion G-protein coupled receptor G5 isoform 1 precursor [Mus musculus]